MANNNGFTRRDFLKNTASGAMGLALSPSVWDALKAKPLLSFSTLGCPKWSLETIVQYAADNRYNGIEIRGIQDQMDLPKCPEFSTPVRIKASRQLVENKGLRIVDLGASAKMHFLDPVQRQANLDEARRYIDLAAQLNCPFIRVFPDDLPPNQEKEQTIELITNGLVELGNYAKGSKVSVLLESHGKVVSKDILHQIMQNVEHPHVGLVWDIMNMWTVTQETPKEVHEKLKKYIRHTHIKDGIMPDGKVKYKRIGEGIVPLQEAITALVKGGYKGYYSFEWEKRWHPDIEDPETAIPHYPKAMKSYF